MTRDELFKIALETRNLEIELFWKRATFFWAFQASALVLVAACITGLDENNNQKSDLFLHVGAHLGLILGLSASLTGYFASRGSKYWQESWEKKFEYFDAYNLFRSTWASSEKMFGVGAWFVSKLTTIFFFICAVVWLISIIFHFYFIAYEIINKDIVFILNFKLFVFSVFEVDVISARLDSNFESIICNLFGVVYFILPLVFTCLIVAWGVSGERDTMVGKSKGFNKVMY